MTKVLSQLATALLLAVSCFLVGCGEATVENPVEGAMDKAKEAGGEMVDKAKEAGGEMMDKAKEAGGDMMDKAKEAGEEAMSGASGSK